MAVILAKLWRRKVMAAVVETTTGTAAALAAAQGAFNAFNHTFKEVSNSNEREGQSSLSKLTPIAGAQSGELSFVTELYSHGDGTIPAAINTLSLGAGFSASGAILTPVTPSPTTLTMGLYQDGRFKSIKGTTLDLTMKFVLGQVPQLQWKGIGVWVPPSDVALITPTYPTDLPLIFTGGTITIGGTAYKVTECEIPMGNQLTLRKDANQASGYFASQITNRKPMIKIPVEALALATKSWTADRVANTSYAFSLGLGTGAGNLCTIAAPKIVQTDAPEDKNESDILYDALTFQCCRSAAAGDDELSVTFS